ncbi:OmpW/AlkL family protein [Piscinibacter sp.]|uniref:OmpW/AlkL family protein n=1 Tax=Piscinibacter sp. TaxID=1903157 RepID=UPI002CC5B4D9|nr:OmpW family outer membrane protein [Albitalea sp.]HUG24887.1 OmpW family outer membrane protein [Albitalea sp.]
MDARLMKLAIAAAALAFGGTATAQSAGTWLIKAGVNRIAPQVESGDLSPPSLPGTKIDVESASSAILTATYLVTDAVSLEFYTGLPYEHDVVGDGAIAGVGKLGSVKQVSPTLFAQYRFMPPSSGFRPYVGLGLTYAHFYDEEGSGTLTALTNPGGPPTKMSASSAWGLSPQIGVSVKLGERWYLDASVIKTYIENTNTLSTGQSIDTKLDPLSTNVSIAYRF